jgi:hypothetical protein
MDRGTPLKTYCRTHRSGQTRETSISTRGTRVTGAGAVSSRWQDTTKWVTVRFVPSGRSNEAGSSVPLAPADPEGVLQLLPQRRDEMAGDCNRAFSRTPEFD